VLCFPPFLSLNSSGGKNRNNLPIFLKPPYKTPLLRILSPPLWSGHPPTFNFHPLPQPSGFSIQERGNPNYNRASKPNSKSLVEKPQLPQNILIYHPLLNLFWSPFLLHTNYGLSHFFLNNSYQLPINLYCSETLP